MSGKSLRSKKKKRKGAGYVPALRFIVLLLILLFVSAVAFLPVERIEISGNAHESAEEVRDTVLKRAPGNSIVLACLLNNGRAPGELPFVRSLSCSFSDAKTLRVRVNEKDITGCMEAGDACWYFNRSGTLMFSREQAEEKNERNFIPLCEGIPLPEDPKTHEVKDPSRGLSLGIRKTFFEDIAAVRDWCKEEGVYADRIVFDENENMTIIFGELEAEMGSFDDLSEKLAALSRLMPEVKGKSGTLDLKNIVGSQKDVHFHEKKS